MVKIFLCFVALLATAGVASAECVYVNDDPSYSTGKPIAQRSEIRINREDGTMTLTDNGKVSVLTTISGGTGISVRAAFVGDGETPVSCWTLDLSGKVKAGEPDHILIFGDQAYWPQGCN